MWCFLLLTLFVTVQGRAVNISNTWVLPEEGFPVFYRYFRDRISWYEADAVCQFHHANLVTVDTTAQYDAVRAYLKELDISSAVWVGLIRSNPDGDFTWTDYRGLSGDGYWSEAPDTRSAPLCAAADPSADYRWEARACGGPSVASFICELPVPQWALGNEGCMVRALPALTILYLPESAAVQLTADCGLAGVRRVQCTGNMKRENLLRELYCAEEEQSTTVSFVTTPSIIDTTFTDQDLTNEISTEENITTEHEDDVNQSASDNLLSTLQNKVFSITERSLLTQQPVLKELYRISLNKNINLNLNNNSLQSDDVSQTPNSNEFFVNENTENPGVESLAQHKKLHEELTRLGNLETIFSQPTDHFVPPLVMAKAKITDDMTAMSIEEKLAQQFAKNQLTDHNNSQIHIDAKNQLTDHNNSQIHIDIGNTKETAPTETFDKDIKIKHLNNSISSISTKINRAKDSNYTKSFVTKKYTNDEIKSETLKSSKLFKFLRTPLETTPNNINTDQFHASMSKTNRQTFYVHDKDQRVEDDTSLELTVIIKEPKMQHGDSIINENYSGNVAYENNMAINKTEHNLPFAEKFSVSPTENKVIMNDEVIKIEIINSKNKHSNIDVTVYEVTTEVPISIDKNNKSTYNNPREANEDLMMLHNLSIPERDTPDSMINDLITASIRSVDENVTVTNFTTNTPEALITGVANSNMDIGENSMNKEINNTQDALVFYNISMSESSEENNGTYFTDKEEKNINETTPEIDDFQSPLLSAANEPLHKPNRSRRPQALQNRAKFNPFRILG